MLGGPATRPKTPLAVENSVGKLAAAEMWRQMSEWEREFGELPSPIWFLLDRKVGQGLDVFTLPLLLRLALCRGLEASLKASLDNPVGSGIEMLPDPSTRRKTPLTWPIASGSWRPQKMWR